MVYPVGKQIVYRGPRLFLVVDFHPSNATKSYKEVQRQWFPVNVFGHFAFQHRGHASVAVFQDVAHNFLRACPCKDTATFSQAQDSPQIRCDPSSCDRLAVDAMLDLDELLRVSNQIRFMTKFSGQHVWY